LANATPTFMFIQRQTSLYLANLTARRVEEMEDPMRSSPSFVPPHLSAFGGLHRQTAVAVGGWWFLALDRIGG